MLCRVWVRTETSGHVVGCTCFLHLVPLEITSWWKICQQRQADRWLDRLQVGYGPVLPLAQIAHESFHARLYSFNLEVYTYIGGCLMSCKEHCFVPGPGQSWAIWWPLYSLGDSYIWFTCGSIQVFIHWLMKPFSPCQWCLPGSGQ